MNKNFLSILSGYASDFHAALEPCPDKNIVASPLGSWMLLASLARSADFSNSLEGKALVERSLHTSIEEASSYLTELLQIKELNYISQVWYRENLLDKYPNVIKWLQTNNLIPSTSSIPMTAELDAWVTENTNSLIKKFPIEVNEDTFFLMANVIYSKFDWKHVFQVERNKSMSTVWGVENFLFSTKTKVEFYNVDEKEYIVYPVQAKSSETVLLTLPVGHSISDIDLLAVAHRIAIRENVTRVSYNDVEPDAGVYLLEHKIGSTPLIINVTLPAWVATSKHDLYEQEVFGYKPISEVLAYGAQEQWEAKAAQSVVAKFKKEGFEAAAVTTFGMMRASSIRPIRIPQDVLTVNFSKPFAFICTIEGVPAFSGIIKEADAEIE